MMFSENQIAFMRSIGLDLDFSNLADDDYVRIEDVVGGIYTSEVQEYRQDATEVTLMCESILDTL